MIRKTVVAAAFVLVAASARAQSQFPGTLPTGCTNGQIPAYQTSTRTWICAATPGAGTVTGTGAANQVAVWSGTSAIGGSSALITSSTTGFGVLPTITTGGTTVYGVRSSPVFNPSVPGTTAYGAYFSTSTPGPNTQQFDYQNGGTFTFDHNGSGDVGILSGVSAYAYNESSGNVPRLYGHLSSLTIYGSGNTTEAAFFYVDGPDGANYGLGTITNLHGLYIPTVDLSGGGPVTNNYGIRIGTVTGGLTLNHAINYADKFIVDSLGNVYSAAATSIASTSANSCGTTSPAFGTGAKNTGGKFTVGATSGTDCTLTFSAAATNGWACGVSNTSTANIVRAVPVTTTTTKFLGVFVAGDVIQYACNPF